MRHGPRAASMVLVIPVYNEGYKEVYRTRFLGHTFALRGLTQLVFLARFERRAIRQLLEAPALIVAFDEPGDGGAHFGQVSGRPGRRLLAP